MRDLADRVAAGEPLCSRSRTCSRRRCPAGLHPPRCAYRIPRGIRPQPADVTTRTLRVQSGYADARVQTIYGGTSEIMKTIIARDLIGLRA
jgi:Acyl-CoA dehydrogenase, C-terminal domain